MDRDNGSYGAGAGSDVGATKTTAEPNADGTYKITGSKVFITGGDTWLTKNVIHLALARIKEAPSGTRGLLLFLVPKIRINPDGSLKEPNDVDVKVVGVEKKMGIKGSPTCQITFGAEGKCVGDLIGEVNKGMPIFFAMMNESRLIAARHGTSVASSAYLHALNWRSPRAVLILDEAAPLLPNIKLNCEKYQSKSTNFTNEMHEIHVADLAPSSCLKIGYS